MKTYLLYLLGFLLSRFLSIVIQFLPCLNGNKAQDRVHDLYFENETLKEENLSLIENISSLTNKISDLEKQIQYLDWDIEELIK